MPRHVLTGWQIDTAEGSRAPLRLRVHCDSLRPADCLKLAVDVTAVLRSAWNAPYRLIGAHLQLDKGTGALETLTLDELGPEISLSGSLDGYGVRTLNFTRYGERLNPLRSWVLGAQRRVTLDGLLGVPGAVQSRPMFDGYTVGGSFETYPPTASVECQDASTAHATKKLEFNLDPGSGRTRKEIVVEILDANEIPYGELDFGPGDGGLVYKGITHGADIEVLRWLEGFLTPIARRVYWRDGRLNIRRISTSGPVQRTLGPADGIRCSVGIPPATSENVVTVSAALYGYLGASGLRTITTVRTKSGTYAPQVATKRQDHTTGALSTLTLTSSAAVRETSRIVTKTTFDGDTPVWWEIEEWGWYAPRACNRYQQADGTITHNPDFDAYLFPDGSWRTEQEESFRVIRTTQTGRTWHETMIGVGYPLNYEETDVTEWRAQRVQIAGVEPAGITETVVAGYRTEEGESWLFGCERFAPGIGSTGTTKRSRTYYTFDEDLRLQSVLQRMYQMNVWYEIIAKPTDVAETTGYDPTVGWAVFGPYDSKTYTRVDSSQTGLGYNFIEWDAVTTYTATSEAEHTKALTVTKANAYIDRPVTPPSPLTQVVPGAIPYVPVLISSRSEPQGATATMTDDPRIALTQRIESTSSNDYCETIGELETVALEQLREVGHVPVTIAMPIDWSISEGEVVVLDHPDYTDQPMTLIVWGMSWSVNLATGENEQTLSCRYYPPAIAPN